MTAIRLVCVLALLGYLSLFVLVLQRARNRRAARYFLAYLFTLAAWQASQTTVAFTGNPQVALQAYRALIPFANAFGFFYAMFVRELLGIRSGRWIVWVGYVSVVAVPLYLLAGGPGLIEAVYRQPDPPLLLPRFGVVATGLGAGVYGFLIYAFFHLIVAHRQSLSPQERNRYTYLIIGIPVVILGTLFNFSPELRAYPIDIVAHLLNATLTGLAIIQYQLLDIQVFIRKGLRYSVTTAIVGMFYFLLVFLFIQVLHLVSGPQVLLLSLVMAAVTAVAVQPLRDALQARVDKTFFREKYDTAQMLQRLSRTAAALLDIDELTSFILAEIKNTMHIERAAFFLKDNQGGFRCAASFGLHGAQDWRVRDDHPMVALIARQPQVFSKNDLDRFPLARAFRLQEREQWQELRAEVVAPVTAKGVLVGLLTVGPKLSGVDYSNEDQNVLVVLANQTAVAVENARLYAMAQKQLAERERAEARLRESLNEKEVLLKEIHHRVKNNLQVIYSLLSLQSQYASDPVTLEVLRDSQNRIRSMALIHEKLYQSSSLANIDFGEYLRSLASQLHRSYATSGRTIRLIVSTASIRLPLDTALPCALVASELISNALKHAFIGRTEGILKVAIHMNDDGQVELEVSDDGIGMSPDPNDPGSSTLGMQLVGGLVRQLEGTLAHGNSLGTTFILSFPTQPA